MSDTTVTEIEADLDQFFKDARKLFTSHKVVESGDGERWYFTLEEATHHASRQRITDVATARAFILALIDRFPEWDSENDTHDIIYFEDSSGGWIKMAQGLLGGFTHQTLLRTTAIADEARRRSSRNNNLYDFKRELASSAKVIKIVVDAPSDED